MPPDVSWCLLMPPDPPRGLEVAPINLMMRFVFPQQCITFQGGTAPPVPISPWLLPSCHSATLMLSCHCAGHLPSCLSVTVQSLFHFPATRLPFCLSSYLLPFCYCLAILSQLFACHSAGILSSFCHSAFLLPFCHSLVTLSLYCHSATLLPSCQSPPPPLWLTPHKLFTVLICGQIIWKSKLSEISMYGLLTYCKSNNFIITICHKASHHPCLSCYFVEYNDE